jgi:hypothetical protein
MKRLRIRVSAARNDGQPDNQLVDVFIAVHTAGFFLDNWTREAKGRWRFSVCFDGVDGGEDAAIERLSAAVGQRIEKETLTTRPEWRGAPSAGLGAI